MVPRPAWLVVCAGLMLAPAARGLADEPTPSPTPRRAQQAAEVNRARPGVIAPQVSSTTPADARARTEAEARQARAEAEGRLKGLPSPESELTPAQKALRDVWNERLTLIEDWRKAVAEHAGAAKPELSPDREIAEHQAEIEQRKAFLEQLANAPESVLPELFRLPSDQVDDAKLAEMSRAIEDRRGTLGDRTSELEKNRAKPAEHASRLHDLGIERDKAHARKSTLPALRATLESAYSSAATEESRRLAREKLINFRWTVAVAEERLATVEAKLATETRSVEAIDLAIKAGELQVKAIQAFLTALSRRYAVVAERRKAALRTEAVREQVRAAASDDPIIKFTARRSSEIHEIEAQLVEYERLLSATPSLSCEEQKVLADRAEADLANLKKLVNDNRLGGLVALRLNNDFRRLSRERGLIQRNELAQSAALNTHYENALTETELTIMNDARDDRFERDAFLETLAPDMRARAVAATDALDAKHKDLLARKKAVLEKLLDRAEKTHAEVARRLRILDEQYAFIRTHLFWVRDSEPLGPATLDQARRDAAKVAAAVARLVAEPLDRTNWTPVTVEFGLMVAALAVLPPLIYYARRRLKVTIAAPVAPTIVVRMD